jgi:hypothetical protein
MELTGAEAYIVPALKFIMLGVMAVGAVAVFREMIPMARGQVIQSSPQPNEEQK